MPGTRRGVALAAGGMLLCATWAEAQDRGAAVVGVHVSVVVDSGRALVQERYRVPSDSGAIQLQLLRRACVTLGPISLSNYRETIELPATGRGPWVAIRDSSGRGFNADSSGFEVRYTVLLDPGGVDVPLVQLTRAIPQDERQHEGNVSLEVTTHEAVRFPRLRRRQDDTWAGRFVAVPSFVRIEPPGERPAGCPAPAWDGNDDGGLTWRFWTLLAIMVAWVPLYLAWARRAQEGEA